MKRLILHCGLHKTGTSYIQLSLLTNEDLLASHGLVFLNHMRDARGSHHALSRALFEPYWAEALRANLALAGEKDVLISAEDFTHSFFYHPETLTHIRTLAALTDRTITLIYYLRRQDDLKESVFAQIVKEWYVGRIEDDNHYPMDFNLLAHKLETELPEANIILRPYCEKYWASGDLIFDFLHSVGFGAVCHKIKRTSSVNVSPSRRMTLYLSSLDKRQLVHYGTVVGRLIKSSVIADDGIKYLISPERRRKYLDTYKDQNMKLALRYNSIALYHYLTNAEFDVQWWPAEEPSESEMAAAAEVIDAVSREWEEKNRGANAGYLEE